METLGLGLLALELEHNLLGVLGFLPEDWLGLSAETFLLRIVSSLTLSSESILTLLVLGDFVDRVLLCFPAVGSLSLWNMHHFFYC